MAPAINETGFSASQGLRRTLLEIGLIVILLAVVVLVGRAAIGWVAEKAAMQLPTSLDAKLGAAAAQAVQAGHLAEAPSADAQARVERIFGELVGSLAPEERAVLGTPKATLIVDSTPNAFALPGGQVFVQTGLLERVGEGGDGDAQVRGVLAHELGHAVRRHSVRLLARRAALGIAIGLLLGNGDQLGESLLAGASRLESLKNSREMETEADDFGVALLERTGVDPSGLAAFLESLGGQPVPELLSTHPDPEERAKRIRDRATR